MPSPHASSNMSGKEMSGCYGDTDAGTARGAVCAPFEAGQLPCTMSHRQPPTTSARTALMGTEDAIDRCPLVEMVRCESRQLEQWTLAWQTA